MEVSCIFLAENWQEQPQSTFKTKLYLVAKHNPVHQPHLLVYNIKIATVICSLFSYTFLPIEVATCAQYHIRSPHREFMVRRLLGGLQKLKFSVS